ncbi:flagellar basal body P-ring formation chaperone FlgA [Novispirillum itersonii]|uniref:flagellar basal body P-ring formation chaperone FlgA n=1 Tax=Novispirillum itersonii TaxID=189 RepID=UPI000382446B|nr:flagellar basal body P-ring formation chaperone FlgA [Novispirillum itersonii]
MTFHRPLRSALLSFALSALLCGQAAAAGSSGPVAAAAPVDVSVPQILQGTAYRELTATDSATVTLRRATAISGDVVRVGDLFQSTTGKALPQERETVMAAPLVGAPIILDAVRLSDIAKRFGLIWTPGQANESATLTRETTTIGSTEIIAVLRQDLVARGMSEDAEVELTSGLQTATIAAGEMGNIAVVDANFDRRTGRFAALVQTGSGNGDTKKLRLAGRAVDTITVPVLSRALGRKDVIQVEDIQWTRMRSTELRDGTILDPERLIGQTAKRPLRAGDQLMLQDIERTVVVTKGQPVVMELVTPYMRLSANGVALEPGGVGDVVQVRNPQSNKVVSGVVTGAHQVRVTPLGQVASAR